jgi:Fic family protein
LPLKVDIETKAVLKALASANRALAELKGIAATIPNEQILISTLTLQEARQSSEIENIITTQDDLFRAEVRHQSEVSAETKEVAQYADALRKGFERVRRTKIINLAMINEIQENLMLNNAGIRKLPGTELKNASTGETIYVPPQHPDTIMDLMNNLVLYINDNELDPIDPLLKMAIIHHQFESIHPYYDGNGRTGRIINMLYLVNQELLNLPILYMSRYIVNNKAGYYHGLQTARTENNWEGYLLYMLKGVEITAKETIQTVKSIISLMQEYKQVLRNKQPKIYSQDLLNNIFRHPYTKIEFIEQDLQISRLTATKYLNTLVETGLLTVQKLGRNNYYLNNGLMDILSSKNLENLISIS